MVLKLLKLSYTQKLIDGQVNEIQPAWVMKVVINRCVWESSPWGQHTPPRVAGLTPACCLSPSSFSNTALYAMYWDGLMFDEAHNLLILRTGPFESESEAGWPA